MATESYQTQLERVQAAIARIEGGAQDVSYEGRRVAYADLATLYARETKLRALVAREARLVAGAGVRQIEVRDA